MRESDQSTVDGAHAASNGRLRHPTTLAFARVAALASGQELIAHAMKADCFFEYDQVSIDQVLAAVGSDRLLLGYQPHADQTETDAGSATLDATARRN